jgi:GT2 family glycosyltransferase
MHPKIAVVILNWNGKDDSLECLDSVHKIDYPYFEVIVVDNGSTDDSVQAFRQIYPNLTLLETGANLGYAGGNNVGIRWALEHGFDSILLLNNDTIVDSGILKAFAEAEQRFPTAGVFGAKIYFYSDRNRLWHAGGKWLPETMKFTHVGMGEQDSPEYSQVQAYDYVTGCALYATANVFREIGTLNEKFFLTYEETDWCYRARKQGYSCLFIPEAKLWHKISVSFGGSHSPIFNYFMTRNKLLWASKHLPWRSFIFLQIKMIKSLSKAVIPKFVLNHGHQPFLKTLLWGFHTWLGNLRRNLNDPSNKAKLYGLRDFYLTRFGDCPPQVRSLARISIST